jgi:acetyl-CoA/propionyl-CoA carboxylase biotin carboxyl carrier protein
MFERVLIANRGEIAVRVARTLRRLGIESVAVYSDADAGAAHVGAADRAFHLGPTEAAASYLSIERLLDVAARAEVDAVHPGYGFLSERPEFAHACGEAGLVFVGPGPQAMRTLGDKVSAKLAAGAAGVPILPGLEREQLLDAEIHEWVGGGERLPLLVKAAAGGGGKGMRVVRRADELQGALDSARREAKASFGDDRVRVERFVESSRHIEVQVIADLHGNAVHLGERECTLQRRHQKVIEEAPSPVVGAELRERFGAAATALALECDYVNAGTVEFIAERDDPGQFFFLEMNARLQVEHPVTEEVYGVDLVELQLRVAGGEPLPEELGSMQPQGHSVEARIYAESPATGFLPASGVIAFYEEPAGIRMDSGVAEGTKVTSDYDPMLAKAIARGRDREEALARLREALDGLVLFGVETNVAYLGALLADPDVRAAQMDTGLIERRGAAIAAPPASPCLAAVAPALLLEPSTAGDPWERADGWRIGEPDWTVAAIRGPEDTVTVAIRPAEDDWEWRIGEKSGRFAVAGERLTVGGESRPLTVRREASGASVWLREGGAEPLRLEHLADDEVVGRAGGGGSLAAPMPGKVIVVDTEAGRVVLEGEVLVVMESMKMELAIQSPRDGVVAAVAVATGEQVERGRILVELEEPEEAR